MKNYTHYLRIEILKQAYKIRKVPSILRQQNPKTLFVFEAFLFFLIDCVLLNVGLSGLLKI